MQEPLKITGLNQGRTNFPKIPEPPYHSRRQKRDMKQVTRGGTANNWRHRAKFSRPDDRLPEICAPLG
jgi:hypothetical protein